MSTGWVAGGLFADWLRKENANRPNLFIERDKKLNNVQFNATKTNAQRKRWVTIGTDIR